MRCFTSNKSFQTKKESVFDNDKKQYFLSECLPPLPSSARRSFISVLTVTPSWVTMFGLAMGSSFFSFLPQQQQRWRRRRRFRCSEILPSDPEDVSRFRKWQRHRGRVITRRTQMMQPTTTSPISMSFIARDDSALLHEARRYMFYRCFRSLTY